MNHKYRVLTRKQRELIAVHLQGTSQQQHTASSCPRLLEQPKLYPAQVFVKNPKISVLSLKEQKINYAKGKDVEINHHGFMERFVKIYCFSFHLASNLPPQIQDQTQPKGLLE